MAGIAYSNFAR